jgi:hypothetical protein
MKTLTPTIKRRLEIQGFTEVDPGVLAETASWLGFPYGICATLAAVGVILASPMILLALTFFQHGVRYLLYTLLIMSIIMESVMQQAQDLSRKGVCLDALLAAWEPSG